MTGSILSVPRPSELAVDEEMLAIKIGPGSLVEASFLICQRQSHDMVGVRRGVADTKYALNAFWCCSSATALRTNVSEYCTGQGQDAPRAVKSSLAKEFRRVPSIITTSPPFAELS